VRVLLVIGILALAPVARAADRSLSDTVVVSATDECLTHAAVVEHLTSWLERDHVDDRLGVVLDVGEHVRLRVLRGEEVVASRDFEHLPAACPDRRAAVSLAIALAIDGAVLPVLAAPAPEPAVHALPPASAPLGMRLFAEGGALFVGLPDVAPLARVGLALGVDLSLVVSAVYAGGGAPRLGAGTVALSVALAELGGCYGRSIEAHVALEGCVVASVGAVHAEGHGFDVSRAVDLLLAGGGARVAVRFALVPWLAVRVGADVAFPFVRPRWTVSSGGTDPIAGAYAEVAVTAAAGLELTLDAP
jgi:hypothetical protein